MAGAGSLFASLALAAGLGRAAAPPAQALGPAVAGFFYPADARELSALVDELLGRGQGAPVPRLRALVCPHAGYAFSGTTAGFAYAQVRGRDFGRVVILGPSHYAQFKGAALTGARAWRTPLGEVAIAPEARSLGRPFQVDPPCRVFRPGFARAPQGEETPFTYEHSVEVQLPFLQKALPGVPILPAIFGEVDPLEASRALEPLVNARTLVVASSDLSHYHACDVARRLDEGCVKAIVDLDIPRMERMEACGKAPILCLMHLARRKGWKARLLDARNSGDMGAGKASVVGYAAIAFFDPAPADSAKKALGLGDPGTSRLEPGERALLLGLARRSLRSAVRGEPPPQVDPAGLPPALREPMGCFVTLTRKGELRGCIGRLWTAEPLWRGVVDNARAAALQDPRFAPVKAAEEPKLHIEISVLTVPRLLDARSPAERLARLRRTDGVVLRRGYQQATYLPQVWREIPDKEAFLRELSLKAGGPATLWREPGTEVLTYQAEVFEEEGR